MDHGRQFARECRALRSVLITGERSIGGTRSFKSRFASADPARGSYLTEDDLAGARSVLKAAALTYVATALMSLLNLARWIRNLR